MAELSCRSSDLGGQTQPKDESAESNEVEAASEARGGLPWAETACLAHILSAAWNGLWPLAQLPRSVLVPT